MDQKRMQWIDNMRGMAVLLVLLSHTPNNNVLEGTLAYMFMIPSFFLISGYLTRFSRSDAFLFFYNRVVKLLLVYFAYAFILPFLSVSEVMRVVHNPLIIVEKITESVMKFLLGNFMWFVACLIVVNIIFMIIKILAKSNLLLLVVISTIIASFGFGISIILGQHMYPWSADTALVCQWFFVLGHVLRNIEKTEWYKGALVKAVISGMIYVVTVVAIGYKYGFSLISINVALNKWGTLWLTIPLIFICLYSGLHSSRLFTKLRLLPYFGQNSLLYFAIGSHGTSVINKFFALLYDRTGYSILSNRAIINPIIAFLGAVLLLPACWIVNKYFPFFNGRYKLPELKNDNNKVNH